MQEINVYKKKEINKLNCMLDLKHAKQTVLVQVSLFGLTVKTKCNMLGKVNQT